ncbi:MULTISPECIES: hypothetical protein [unclassified Bacillus (in: firmicutes)]|uniref:hypothetical protein n=1 Tax=unclassified Bacillus (in: firmicutes) TaxID=185979 RepID=UPI001BEC2DF7|nr:MULTISPECIES: hypothetical protein [unclassified Bacillus (in: firmicutes)]MBT2639275.1 hypothetical protein [Bacillus sp. ISL-39]MBT2659794.1 hypothetical protein [Bacillus sp. ISL-45]
MKGNGKGVSVPEGAASEPERERKRFFSINQKKRHIKIAPPLFVLFLTMEVQF